MDAHLMTVAVIAGKAGMVTLIHCSVVIDKAGGMSAGKESSRLTGKFIVSVKLQTGVFFIKRLVAGFVNVRSGGRQASVFADIVSSVPCKSAVGKVKIVIAAYSIINYERTFARSLIFIICF